MAAYVVIAIRAIHDPEKLGQYRQGFDRLLERYRGRRVIATDQVHVLEGDWRPERLVMYAFDDMTMEQLQAAYASEEYQPLLWLRQEAIDSDIVVVEGL